MTVATIDLPRPGFDAADPLTTSHRAELAKARDRSKKIRKAARVAAFNGWTTAIIATLSAPFALFDATSAVITGVLVLVAYIEFRGRRCLLDFDPSAARLLGWNQIGLLATIVVYCLWMLGATLTDSTGTLAAEMEAISDLDPSLGIELQSLVKLVAIALYGGVIVLSALFQGANAIYYFTRRRYIDVFVAETPAWVRDILRDGQVA
jgi:hypothetical protein